MNTKILIVSCRPEDHAWIADALASRVDVGMIQVEFANASEESAECAEFENELSVEGDGYAMLAPYGDFPGNGFRKKPDGLVETFSAVQRMDRETAQEMADKFHSLIGRAKRFVTGCPIYNGHPNTLTGKNKYPDKEAKGTIVDLQARENGLYCRPVFYNEAAPILEGNSRIYFSGHWTSNELPKENGKRIFRPDRLKSAGLTTHPNLPVEHANAREREKTDNQSKTMDRSKIIALLVAMGIQFANDATDDAVTEELKKLGAKAKTADALATEKTEWANEKTRLNGEITARDSKITTLTSERDTHQTNFANERKTRIGGLLDAAITDGRITEAERADWNRRLENQTQFANESEALTKLGKKVKTVSITSNAGERKVEIANAADRAETVRNLVAEEMGRNGGNYSAAYATVQQKNPALFQAMSAPEIKLPKHR